MSYEVLNTLLKEYEQRKMQAELDLDRRKADLYKKIPELQQIDTELSNFAIETTRNILKKGESSAIEDLDKKIEALKSKKASILRNANLPPDYLKPAYGCSICKDTGYVIDENDSTKMCSCLKQKILDASFNKSNMANLNKENFDTFNENLFSDEVDLAKYNFNISPRQNIINIKNKCIEFTENFDNPDTKNLLFTGNTGLREDIYV